MFLDPTSRRDVHTIRFAIKNRNKKNILVWWISCQLLKFLKRLKSRLLRGVSGFKHHHFSILFCFTEDLRSNVGSTNLVNCFIYYYFILQYSILLIYGYSIAFLLLNDCRWCPLSEFCFPSVQLYNTAQHKKL